MKKNIRNLAIICSTIISLSSCQDAIDIVQEGEISESAVFVNSQNLEKYLNGEIYSSLDNSSRIKFTSLFTDELRLGPSSAGGSDISLYRFVITPNSGYAATIWSNNYTIISRVNTLLKGAQNFSPSTADVAQYNNSIAEARAIRALAYMDLLSYFSSNMKDDNALGVMLSTEPQIVGTQLPRVNNGEIWNVIEDDLNFAYSNINASYQVTSNRNNSFYISKAAVSAMKARMYLYRGNYPLAKTNAQNAISESGLSLTPAFPIPTGTVGSATWSTAFYNVSGGTNPYRRMWADGIIMSPDVDETIFKLSRPATGTGGIAGLWTTNSSNFAGAVQWTYGLNTYDIMESLTNDIRYYAFIDPTSSGRALEASGIPENTYIIDKYPGKGTTPLRNDIKLFRISEMELILAECEAQTSLTDAAVRIKKIRDARRYTGTTALPVYPTKQDALRDILAERRVELSLEGHRYIDLKRLGQEAGVGINRNANDDWMSPSTPTTLNVTDYRFTLPIPTSEINGNPSIQQNQGY